MGDGLGEGGTITVQARPHPKLPAMVEVLVSDTGPGIPASIRSRLFEPFVSTKASGKGTGLGLALVQRIVKTCGGYVEVVDTPGSGTAIGIGLPAATEADAKLGAMGGIIA
ncbi:MAG: HAMP domain-containing sensor histidine kinase [Planctomycetota bacterium]|nr:HAMP domain-containing sensor histidine kinase [Planctomycetota bacterium]